MRPRKIEGGGERLEKHINAKHVHGRDGQKGTLREPTGQQG